MPTISPERFAALRELRGFTQSDMGNMLGVSAKYVGMIERGEKSVDSESSLGLLFQVQEGRSRKPAPTDWAKVNEQIERDSSATTLREGSPRYDCSRKVPVIGWAHAGDVTNYDEIPKDWQDWVETKCRDQKAFAVRIEGNSMADFYHPGDVLILSPSNEIYSGCLAVIKLKDDGFIFRQIERRADHLKLIPLNHRWNVEELPLAEVEWAFPIFGMYRQVWK